MKKWILQWRSPKLDYYWHHNFVHQIYKNKMLKQWLGVQEEYIICDNNLDYSFYILDKEIERVEKYAYSFYLNDKKYKKWISTIKELGEKVEKLSWEIEEADAKNRLFQIQYLEKLFHKAVSLHLLSQPHLTAVLSKNSDVGDEELKNYCTLQEKPKVIVEQEEWNHLVNLIDNNPSRKNEYLSQHLNKWKYITAGDSKGPMTMCYLESRLRNSVRKIAVDNQLPPKSVSLSCLSNKDKKLVSRINEISLIRFYTKEIWMKLWYLLEINISCLGEQLGIAKIFDYTLEEIIDNKQDQHNRSEYFYMIDNSEFLLYSNGLDREIRNSYLNSEDYSTITKITGEQGYHGYAVGEALVIDWGENVFEYINQVTQNTILVVPQTTPDYIGLITRCKALVVDEGGVTGHACIVSRELKIPSVIGTRIGTKVFKTGDKLIVDVKNKIVEKCNE